VESSYPPPRKIDILDVALTRKKGLGCSGGRKDTGREFAGKCFSEKGPNALPYEGKRQNSRRRKSCEDERGRGRKLQMTSGHHSWKVTHSVSMTYADRSSILSARGGKNERHEEAVRKRNLSKGKGDAFRNKKTSERKGGKRMVWNNTSSLEGDSTRGSKGKKVLLTKPGLLF